MTTIKDVEHFTIFRDKAHCVNQIATRLLKNGDILAVFNEERFPFHHDSGQTLMTRSSDGGKTWSQPKVVLPWSETQGNWDCGICETRDGTLIVNLTITGFFKRGIKQEQPSWSSHPNTPEWGDWTWAYKTQAWLGTGAVCHHTLPPARRLGRRMNAPVVGPSRPGAPVVVIRGG